MYYYLIIIVILLAILFYISQSKQTEKYENFMEDCPNFTDISQDTHILMAPNIPMDPRFEFKIGGKYLPFEGLDSLSPESGKYKFPIRHFKYDGIYQNYNNIQENNNYAIEINKWSLNKLYDYFKAYFTDKYFILPSKYSDPGFKELDENAFYKNRMIGFNTKDEGPI